MATSGFGVLKPLHMWSQRRQRQHLRQQAQQQQQQQQEGQQQQPHYSQLGFQPTPQFHPHPHHPSVPSALSPPSQQQQQQHARAGTVQQPTANYGNGHIHPQLQTQSHSPALNGATAGPRQPRQLQTVNPTASSLNTSPTNPSAPAPVPAPATATATESATDPSDPSDPQRRRRSAGRPSKRRRSDNDDEPAFSPPVPPRPHTVHPLSKGPYDTLEDAIFSLQLHVFTSGYGVSQKRTVKEKLPSGKYDPDGDVIRKDFACDKGGNEFVSQSRGERRRESKKCGCPWKAAIRRLRREGDRWFIEILEPQHNHPVTSPDEMHTLASYRRWQRENNAGIRCAISRLTRAAAMPARDIAAYLKGEIQDRDLDRIDRQILRALSINDKELAGGGGGGGEKESSSVVFEMVARRPVIILQDNDRTTVNASSSAPNPSSALVNNNNNNMNLATPTTSSHESPVTSNAPFAATFANHPPNPQPNPLSPATNEGDEQTTNMQSEYPAVP
ncbi:hypothetical protein F4678DRAFT_446146 [Xylaria arbuscula]|nr:hypothetical protein F4678DRAFT_446146 [Xylaria arbuscula]